MNKYLVILIGLLIFSKNSLTNTNLDLIKEVKNNNISKVEKLLQNGANVNAKDNDGYTVLLMAVIFRHTDIVKLLLKHKADINAIETSGYNALMLASVRGYIDIVKILLKHNANVNVKNINNGFTALMLALLNRHIDITKLLLEASADVNITNNNGSTALKIATQFRKIEIIRLLESIIEVEKDIHKFIKQNDEIQNVIIT